MFAKGFKTPDETIQDVKISDPQFRASFATTGLAVGLKDEVDIVANLKIPIMIIHGVKEQAVNGEWIEKLTIPKLYKGEMQKLDCGHAPHIGMQLVLIFIV